MTSLIDPIALANRVGAQDFVLIDARYTLLGPPGRPEYEAGHVPGAQYLDMDTELAGPPGAGGRHPLPDTEALQARLRAIGMNDQSQVVVYDAATSVSAARVWWLLTDAGHDRVRVLDGGYAAWLAAGFPVEIGPGRPVKPGRIVLQPGHRAQLDADGVTAALAAGRPVIDVRAAERYAGENEIVDPVAGHIPGALSLPATENQEPDGRFRAPAEIAARFAGLEDPVLYCGSGVTAAQTLLALETAGLGGAIYPGSWSDWITDPTRPVATGESPGGEQTSTGS